MTIRVVRATRTCGGYPAQWDGVLEDGRTVYARYRSGYLSVQVSESPKPTEEFAAVEGPVIVSLEHGGAFDGMLTFEALRELTRGKVEWPEVDEDPFAHELKDE